MRLCLIIFFLYKRIKHRYKTLGNLVTVSGVKTDPANLRFDARCSAVEPLVRGVILHYQKVVSVTRVYAILGDQVNLFQIELYYQKVFRFLIHRS